MVNATPSPNISAPSLKKQGAAENLAPAAPTLPVFQGLQSGGPPTAQAPQPATPPPGTQGMAPAQQENKAQWQGFLSNPHVRLGIMQAGLGLLAGQPLGEALGGGFAAAGRSNLIERGQGMEDAAFAMDMAGKAQGLAKGSRGSRGSNSGKGVKGTLTAKQLAALTKKYSKYLTTQQKDALSAYNKIDPLLGGDPGPAPTTLSPMQIEHLAQQAARLEGAGVPMLEIDSYLGASSSPDNLPYAGQMADIIIERKNAPAEEASE